MSDYLERQSVRGEVERPTISQERVVRREVRERRRRGEVRRCRGEETRAPSMHPGPSYEALNKKKLWIHFFFSSEAQVTGGIDFV